MTQPNKKVGDDSSKAKEADEEFEKPKTTEPDETSKEADEEFEHHEKHKQSHKEAD